ncbi:LacI family DNA-binding transcriptional regulator [Microbacterium sp. NPDC091313]
MPQSATIRDVAERARVSVGTVSNYLNETKPIAPATADRIRQAISDLRFIPNTAVRIVRGARNHAIGLLIPDPSNPFFNELARGIEEVTFPEGLLVMACNTKGDPDREEYYAQALAEMRVLGVIATATNGDAYLDRLRDSGAAVVVLGSARSETEHSLIRIDEFAGGYAATEHLISRGHENIVLVGGPAGMAQITERFAGAAAAMEAAGLDPHRLSRVDTASGATVDRMAAAERIRSLSPRPTAAFCANDVIALAIEASLLQLGLRVPEDLAIVGYDDIDGAALAPVPLTTMRQPQFEMGEVAANIVLKLARHGESPSDVTFVPSLVVRASAP